MRPGRSIFTLPHTARGNRTPWRGAPSDQKSFLGLTLQCARECHDHPHAALETVGLSGGWRHSSRGCGGWRPATLSRTNSSWPYWNVPEARRIAGDRLEGKPDEQERLSDSNSHSTVYGNRHGVQDRQRRDARSQAGSLHQRIPIRSAACCQSSLAAPARFKAGDDAGSTARG